MKRFITLLLLLCICTSLFACSEEKIISPVSFYYLRSDLSYGAADSAVAAEIREGADYGNDYVQLLREYLDGPLSEDYVQTIPDEVVLIACHIDGNMADVVLSDEIAQLSGMDLTVACACLTLTTIGLTGVETVQIRALTDALESGPSVIMDRNCLIFLDNGAFATDPTEET